MKIGAILEYEITSGGGFNQALNAILQLQSITNNHYDFLVFTSVKENIDWLKQKGVTAILFKENLIDKFLALAATSPILRNLQSKLKLVGGLERVLIRFGVDLAYFVTPGTRCLALQKTNYITTVWDVSHMDTPEFPEVREYNMFHSREYAYQATLKQSLAVIVDSVELKEKLKKYYCVPDSRIVVMPFGPSPFLDQDLISSEFDSVMQKYQIRPGYMYYPAQFWAHKNHYRLIHALSILVAKGFAYRLVFSGRDYGNLKTIRDAIKKYNLQNHVSVLGFIPSNEVKYLFQGCSAVVMPTYFGTTNLPPLEAWYMKKPLVYSSHLTEQVRDAAFLADPDSAEDWALAIERVMNSKIAQTLVENGSIRLMQISKDRELATHSIINILNTFAKRIQCWKSD